MGMTIEPEEENVAEFLARKTDVAESKRKLSEKIDRAEIRLSGKLAETKLTDKITEATAILHSDNKTQFRWFIGILVTVMLSKGEINIMGLFGK